jgi:hypothetical protein
MGIFDSIKKVATDTLKKAATTTSTPVASANAAPPNTASAKAAALVGSKVGGQTGIPNPALKVLSNAEVEATIEAMAREKGMQNSNWRVSIVDLMTVLGMNSSLTARKALAAKLNYSGYDADGSAEKNMWLHAELLKGLAQNGGKVPSNLL